MRFADSDYGSDDPGNSDISDDVHYEASLLNRSSDYTRPRPRYVTSPLMVLLFAGPFACIVYSEEA